MPKVIAQTAREALTDRTSPTALIGLVTLRPADGGDPIRICTDPFERLSVDPLKYGLVSRGETYWYTVLNLILPDNSKDRMPSSSLGFDNLTFEMVKAARSSIFQAKLDLEVVLSSAIDDVIESWPSMNVTEATFDADTVSLTVSYETFVGEPLHKYRLTRNVAPALRPNS